MQKTCPKGTFKTTTFKLKTKSKAWQNEHHNKEKEGFYDMHRHVNVDAYAWKSSNQQGQFQPS